MIGNLLAAVQHGSLIAWPEHLDLPHIGARIDLGFLGEVMVIGCEFTTCAGYEAMQAVRVRPLPRNDEL